MSLIGSLVLEPKFWREAREILMARVLQHPTPYPTYMVPFANTENDECSCGQCAAAHPEQIIFVQSRLNDSDVQGMIDWDIKDLEHFQFEPGPVLYISEAGIAEWSQTGESKPDITQVTRDVARGS